MDAKDLVLEPVIYCKDCPHYRQNCLGNYFCDALVWTPKPDDWCCVPVQELRGER